MKSIISILLFLYIIPSNKAQSFTEINGEFIGGRQNLEVKTEIIYLIIFLVLIIILTPGIVKDLKQSYNKKIL